MRDENELTRDVVKAIRQRRPEWVVWKLHDDLTAGVPDVMVSASGRVTWFEAKRLFDESFDGDFVLLPEEHVPQYQWDTLVRLRRGFVVVYHPRGCCVFHACGPRCGAELVARLVDAKTLVAKMIAICEEER